MLYGYGSETMTFDTPEKELEWIDHFQNTYNTTLTEREKIIYHIAFEDGERNQIRRINAEKIREGREAQAKKDLAKSMMETPIVKDPLSFEDALSRYPEQMTKIGAQIGRSTQKMGKAKKPINTFDYPEDFQFYICTQRMWTSIRKDGVDELKSVYARMRKYDVVFTAEISKEKLL
jgi:hypothetical protein